MRAFACCSHCAFALSARRGPGAEISQMGVFLGVTLMGNLRIGCYFVLLQFRAVAHFRACLAAATALFCALRCLSVSSIHTSSLFDIVHTKAISKTVLKLGEATEMFGIPKWRFVTLVLFPLSCLFVYYCYSLRLLSSFQLCFQICWSNRHSGWSVCELAVLKIQFKF